MSVISKETLQSLSKKFSINNFVADLPRMLNDAFNTVVSCILDFYNPDEQSVSLNKVKATYIDATTVTAQNMKFKGNDGELYNYKELLDKILVLENAISKITNITKEQIDALHVYPVQSWPLYADGIGTESSVTSPTEGYKLLLQNGGANGLATYTSGSWVETTVDDGAMYLCASDWHVYKYIVSNSNGNWMDLGSYK